MKVLRSKACTNGVRHLIKLEKACLVKDNRVVKGLLKNIHRYVGRSSITGRITVWHRQSGAKRLFRQTRFKNSTGLAVAVGIDYDPNRSAISLVNFDLESKSFFRVLSVENLMPGCLSKYESCLDDIRIGFRSCLKSIPPGAVINSLSAGSGNTKFIRAAGTCGQLVEKGKFISKVRLPSGKIVEVSSSSGATVGVLSNAQHSKVVLGKAGKNRLRGRRPIVRGIAMNPVDHPHGGRTNGGKPSVSPWGIYTKCGYKLRKKKK